MTQRLIQLKEERDRFSNIFEDFNSPLSVIDILNKQKLIRMQIN